MMSFKFVHMRSYWICAFCVDQHVSICDTPGKEKYENGDPRCEMDKFEAMMSFLKNLPGTNGRFMQVIAVDRKFEIFERAWCLAEIAEAHRSQIRPHLIMSSAE